MRDAAPHYAVVDLRMPGGSGLDVVRALRALAQPAQGVVRKRGHASWQDPARRVIPRPLMIQVQDVTKAFAGRKLFESVSTTFPPGRRYGLTGPNGAGKSTFMKILAGELEPDAGVISRPKRFSVLKQDQYAFEARKVLDVVLMGNASPSPAMQEKERLLAKA